MEIGYGLDWKYEHKGYMTEAAGSMCRWALEQEEVRAVIAETEPDGLALCTILGRIASLRVEDRGKFVVDGWT